MARPVSQMPGELGRHVKPSPTADHPPHLTMSLSSLRPTVKKEHLCSWNAWIYPSPGGADDDHRQARFRDGLLFTETSL